MIAHNPTIVSEFIFERAPFRSCHASTIVQTASGKLLAAWFGGTHEGAKDVGIYLSRHERGHWTTPVEVATGKGPKGEPEPCYNPVLFQPAKGPLTLFYKVGPNVAAWSGWKKTSTDDGMTWSAAIELPPGILGPVKDKPIQLRSGRILAGSSEERGGWTVHFEYSDDQGSTWQRTKSVNEASSIGAIQPTLLTGQDGTIMAVGRTDQGKIFYIDSNDKGESWSDMKLLKVNNPNSGIDAVTLRSGEFLMVYNDSTSKRTPLDLAQSRDGVTWQKVAVLEDKPGEYSYPAIIQTSDGKVHITYTWNRVKIKHVVFDLSALPSPETAQDSQ